MISILDQRYTRCTRSYSGPVQRSVEFMVDILARRRTKLELKGGGGGEEEFPYIYIYIGRIFVEW